MLRFASRHRMLLAPLLLLLSFALRLYRLPVQSIWWDEGHSITMASAPLGAIPTLPGMDVHPPGYFWLLHLWMGLAGRSEYALRFFSLIFGVATVALLFSFAIKLTAEMPLLRSDHRRVLFALGAAAIAALSPLHIAYAQEVRMYAQVTFLSLGSIYAFWSLLQSRNPFSLRKRVSLDWLVYVLTTAASLYTHYFFGFVLIFQNIYQGLAWALRRRTGERLPLHTWLTTQFAVALLYAPQLLTAARQVTAYRNVNLAPPTPGEFVGQTWQAFTIGLAISGMWAGPLLLIVGSVLFLGGAVALAGWWRAEARLVPYLPAKPGGGENARPASALWVTDRLPASRPLAFLTAWLVIPLAAYFAVLQRRASFEPRYLMLITPALYLLLAWAIAHLMVRARLLGCLGSLALFVPLLVGDYSYFFDPAFHKDDTRGLAAFLAAEATARDVIFWDIPYAIDYYYPGDAGRAPGRYLFVDIHTVADVLSREARGRERLFWVRWRGSDTDPRGVVVFLLEKYGAKLGEQDFQGYNIVWYRLPPSDHKPLYLSLAPAMEPAAVDFGGHFLLTGLAYGGRSQGETASETEVNEKEVAAGRGMWATLDWQAERPPAEDFKVALYLRDQQGHLVAQDDRDLLSDRHLRTSGWTAGERATNVYLLPVAPGTPPGEYVLEAAVYDKASLARLEVLDEGGHPLGAAAVLGTMQVVRPQVPPSVESLGMGHLLQVLLGSEIELLGYDGGEGKAETGVKVPLTLYWRALDDVRRDYLVRLELRDSEGNASVVEEVRPAGGRYATERWIAGEVVRDRHDLPVPPATQPDTYRVEVSLLDAEKAEVVGQAALGQLVVEGRVHNFAIPPIQQRAEANLGGKVKLLGYDLDSRTVTRNSPLVLTLYWQALAEMDTSYTVFVHLLDEKEKIRGQRDSVPGGGTMPTSSWLRGEVIADHYEIPVDAQAPPGIYQVEVGMYEAGSGVRLPVLDAAGRVQGDRILLEEVEIR
jgi:mannosyltransferase